MKNKNIFIIIGAILLIIIIVVACNIPEKGKEKNKEKLLGINYNISGNETTLNDYDTENPVVAMYIKNYGSIVIELYPDIAPNTVNNFISLVKSGFYDNNSFHRLVPDFVLQGGDPKGDGTGGPGYSIKGEFSNNGFENNLKHEKGIVSMARSNDNDSAGRIATMALKTVLPKQYEVIDDPPKVGKDFNDFLCAKVGINYKKRYEKER